MAHTPRRLDDDGPVYRVVVEFLTVAGEVRATHRLGPWPLEHVARGQATAARNAGSRNGGKVRTRLETSRPGWELVEEVTA